MSVIVLEDTKLGVFWTDVCAEERSLAISPQVVLEAIGLRTRCNIVSQSVTRTCHVETCGGHITLLQQPRVFVIYNHVLSDRVVLFCAVARENAMTLNVIGDVVLDQ